MDLSKDKLVARYYELCDLRDAKYAEAKPLEDQLTAVNAEIATKQEQAHTLAGRIDATLGGASWIDMKKEIARIARFLVSIPPRPSPPTE